MPCPWYQNGYCTSPVLGVPTDVVVSPDRCLSDSAYRSCRFYVDPHRERMVRSVRLVKREPYLPISALPQEPKIGCEFAIVEKKGDFYVVYCIARQTYLTRWDVELCEKFWQQCPIRAMELGKSVEANEGNG